MKKQWHQADPREKKPSEWMKRNRKIRKLSMNRHAPKDNTHSMANLSNERCWLNIKRPYMTTIKKCMDVHEIQDTRDLHDVR